MKTLKAGLLLAVIVAVYVGGHYAVGRLLAHQPSAPAPARTAVDVVHVPRVVWDDMRAKETALIAELKAEKAKNLQGLDLKAFVTRLGQYSQDVIKHIDNPTPQSGARLKADSVGLGKYLDSLDTGA